MSAAAHVEKYLVSWYMTSSMVVTADSVADAVAKWRQRPPHCEDNALGLSLRADVVDLDVRAKAAGWIPLCDVAGECRVWGTP